MEMHKPVHKMAPKLASEAYELSFDVDELPDGAIIAPLLDCCIISPLKPKEKTKGGIILADQSKEVDEYCAQFGKIVAVGEFFYGLPPLRDAKVKPKVGDYVMFKPYSGHRFDCDGKRFIIMTEKTPLIIINPAYSYNIYT